MSIKFFIKILLDFNIQKTCRNGGQHVLTFR